MSKIYQALKKAEAERTTKAPGGASTLEIPKLIERIGVHKITSLLAPRTLVQRLDVLHEPGSLVAEQFRKIRAQLWNLHGQARTLLITSALPQEGKTFVVANLAIALAMGIHEHVLLVDTDFRRSSLHTWFGLQPQGGLANYLAGEGELSRYLLKTAVPKLTLLPAGIVPPNPSELLASQRMRELVREIRDRYPDRYVLFDASPVLPTTEPNILAPQVDGVVLVVRAAKTPGPAILRVIEGLNGSRLLGIVFNRVEKVFPGSYSQYPYYYSNNEKGMES
ncbi:MAG: polysaccharide biosynthesis tyrosine autokinase [Candidatus Tectomicrobia bacterium]|uniref:non-specific protein-tyrosine kinase n=1 Tax=Tectimicrobiota bacterium TaxID=2528274 RepID=A0A932CQ57_UNCTE|nr:polysaccharide biosynthesis tyrosine autokinase [Candidatus Tectomicrobia bacterium]